MKDFITPSFPYVQNVQFRIRNMDSFDRCRFRRVFFFCNVEEMIKSYIPILPNLNVYINDVHRHAGLSDVRWPHMQVHASMTCAFGLIAQKAGSA